MKKIICSCLLLINLAILVGCGIDNGMGGRDYIYAPYLGDGENYLEIIENPFLSVKENNTSSFAMDTSTAGYANIRRMINKGVTVPKNAVKIEEMVNYFNYDYPAPASGEGLGIVTEIFDCPWNIEHKLISIGVKAEELEVLSKRKNNIVFLLDISGSMDYSNKLPLMQSAFKLFVETLDDDDTISVVTYANGVDVRLNGAKGFEKKRIVNIIEDLQASGRTAGTKALARAYEVATENFIENGNNRIILGTDGDFNIGISSNSKLKDFIIEKRESGIFISVLGFGTGNLKDDKLEIITQNGNGKYSYIDTITEARKVLVEEIGGTLNVVAKDVKSQVTFNPFYISKYRLIGYENKLLTDEEFADEKTDAGDIGAGHVVTAVYEVIFNNDITVDKTLDDNWLKVAVRFKNPKDNTSKEIILFVNDEQEKDIPSEDILFISGVIEAGLLLRDSQYKGIASYYSILLRLSELESVLNDEYKQEFLGLIRKLSDEKEA
ncbi:MAG: von Willebrand factor type A domain-containing protein [Bacilli bacterium]|nr:von Willebrand factor type A domain-containing protein [Bacilli bacterium]MDD4388514.1 von Willebrand factor type A domain-containing protein [Bacilli bacterium]